MHKLTSSIAALTLAAASQAAIVEYDLIGTGGPGLHFLSEPAVATGGTGGEIGLGIFLDDVTNLLTVNVGWGSSQGFTDLSSLMTNQHIHGPTANVNGNNGVGDFRQTAGVAINLTRSTNAVTGGIFTNPPISLTAAQVVDLNEGQFYINIHTANNGGGELRGFIVPAPVVPEPTSAVLLGLGACALGMIRRRR